MSSGTDRGAVAAPHLVLIALPAGPASGTDGAKPLTLGAAGVIVNRPRGRVNPGAHRSG